MSFTCHFLSLNAALESESPVFKQFEEYAQKAMEDWKVPGMAIAIVKEDKVVFAKGFGVTRAKGNKKVNSETIFQIGSIS